jgi:hypothetical protein
LAGVRRWRKKLLDSGTSPITTAKAYRFLRAVMNTAVDDGLIKRNPCRIKGAGTEDSPERPVLTHLGWLPSSAVLIFASSTGSPLTHSNFRQRALKGTRRARNRRPAAGGGV